MLSQRASCLVVRLRARDSGSRQHVYDMDATAMAGVEVRCALDCPSGPL